MSRFFQCAMCMEFRDFQFMRIVFLATVSATRSERVCGSSSFSVDRSPNKQRDGESGMWQPKTWDNVSVIFFQKW